MLLILWQHCNIEFVQTKKYNCFLSLFVFTSAQLNSFVCATCSRCSFAGEELFHNFPSSPSNLCFSVHVLTWQHLFFPSPAHRPPIPPFSGAHDEADYDAVFPPETNESPKPTAALLGTKFIQLEILKSTEAASPSSPIKDCKNPLSI